MITSQSDSRLNQLQNYILPILVFVGVVVALGIGFAPAAYLWLIAGLAGAILAGVALIRYPVLSIPAVLLIAPLAAYEARAGWPIIGRPPLASGQIVFGAVIIFWLISWLVRKERTLPKASSFTWLLAFAGVMLVTVLSARSTADGAKEVVKWIELGLMMLICIDLAQLTAKRWGAEINPAWLLVCFVTLSAVVQSAIGISQFLNPDGPESFQILGRFYRAFGTFEQPNPYGGFLAWHFVLLAGIVASQLMGWLAKFADVEAWTGRIDPKQLFPAWLLMPLLAVTGFVGAALVASWSRGGWLAAVAGCGAIAFFWPQKRRTGIALIGAAVVALILLWQSGLLPDSIVNRLASSTEFQVASVRDLEVNPSNFALLERQAFWQAAFNMFEEDVWTGVGFGNYDAAYPDHFVGRWERSLGHAHNYYINLLAESGILGLLAYMILWGVIIWQMVRQLPQLSAAERGLALGLIGVWIALSAHHLVDKLYVNNNWLTLATFLAMQELLIHGKKITSQEKLTRVNESDKI